MRDLGFPGCLIVGVIVLIFAFLISLIPATLFYFAWGWVGVGVFKWPVLTFWQCWLVWFVLASIFGGASSCSKKD